MTGGRGIRNRPLPDRVLLANALLIGGSLIVGSLIAACGIPTDESPQVEAFPADLLKELPPTTATPVPQPESEVDSLSLYFHDNNDQLVRVRRPIAPSPTINDALQFVVVGPSEEEQRLQAPAIVLPRLPSNLNPVVTSIEDGTAVITVADAADFRNDPNRLIAAAELVCTAVQYRDVDGVYIEDSEGTIPLTDLEASPISGPANASHYENCVPPPPPAAPQTEAPTEQTVAESTE